MFTDLDLVNQAIAQQQAGVQVTLTQVTRRDFHSSHLLAALALYALARALERRDQDNSAP